MHPASFQRRASADRHERAHANLVVGRVQAGPRQGEFAASARSRRSRKGTRGHIPRLRRSRTPRRCLTCTRFDAWSSAPRFISCARAPSQHEQTQQAQRSSSTPARFMAPPPRSRSAGSRRACAPGTRRGAPTPSRGPCGHGDDVGVGVARASICWCSSGMAVLSRREGTAPCAGTPRGVVVQSNPCWSARLSSLALTTAPYAPERRRVVGSWCSDGQPRERSSALR